jgi:hypothetical protein
VIFATYSILKLIVDNTYEESVKARIANAQTAYP